MKYIDGMNMYAYCANNPVNWIDPWGLKHYNYEETQRILEREHHRYSNPGGVGLPWTPLRHLIDHDWTLGWGYDYKFTDDTFTVINEKGKEDELEGSEFGNYIAGYLAYYWWGQFGEWGMYKGGEWYDYDDNRDILSSPFGMGDDLDSKPDIAHGVEDAKKQIQKEKEEGRRRPARNLWEVGIGL